MRLRRPSPAHARGHTAALWRAAGPALPSLRPSGPALKSGGPRTGSPPLMLSTAHAYPFPLIADLGLVGYAVPLAVGLALFPRVARKQLGGWRVLLDAVVIAAGVLFIGWATVLRPLIAAGGSRLGRVVSLAYTVADVAVAALVLTLGARARAGTRRMWLLLGSGLVPLAVTDSLYVTPMARGEAGLTGTLLTAGWMAAFLLVAAALFPPTRPSKEPPPGALPWLPGRRTRPDRRGGPWRTLVQPGDRASPERRHQRAGESDRVTDRRRRGGDGGVRHRSRHLVAPPAGARAGRCARPCGRGSPAEVGPSWRR